MAKMFCGNAPEGDEWSLLDEITDQSIRWNIFEKDQQHSNEWMTYKVCAEGRAPHKANYWFSRNAVTGQVGFTRDLTAMLDKRPDLYHGIMNILEKRA